jgi:hypothetical protein
MANLKNWLPDMTPEEMAWFDKCPKAVLFEIARQFGMRIADDFTTEGAFAAMKNEWDVLHVQEIVPQKPPGKTREVRKPRPAWRLGDCL